mgnify:CR=1 FL=1
MVSSDIEVIIGVRKYKNGRVELIIGKTTLRFGKMNEWLQSIWNNLAEMQYARTIEKEDYTEVYASVKHADAPIVLNIVGDRKHGWVWDYMAYEYEMAELELEAEIDAVYEDDVGEDYEE